MRRHPAVRWIVGGTALVLAVAAVAALYASRDGAGEDPASSDRQEDATGPVAAGDGDGGDSDGDGGPDEYDGWHGALVNDPQPRPDFTLTTTGGEPYDFRAETEGRLTLLFFGYTSCPDICPVQMATLSAALDDPDLPDPAVVFVTTDPERDTPEHLRQWLDNFGTDFVGLTGTIEEIHRAEVAAGVDGSYYVDGQDQVLPTVPDDLEDYEVGHAAQVVAYTPDDLTHIVYPFGVQRADWAADLPRLAEGWTEDPAPPGS